MGIKLKLTHFDNRINFVNQEYGIFGYTNYSSGLFEELTKVNWYVDEKKTTNNVKTYIYTGSSYFKNYKLLHQVIMMKAYGYDAIKAAYENRFIIEHHNNNSFDCSLENMSFASNDLNLAKAHTFDKQQPTLMYKEVAVNFFKNVKTNEYQITLGFTETYRLIDNEGNNVYIDKMFLLYDDNFKLVFTDASRIVSELLENKTLELRLLSYKKMTFKKSEIFIIPEKEEFNGIRFHKNDNGEMLMLLGKNCKQNFFINSIAPNDDLYNI